MTASHIFTSKSGKEWELEVDEDINEICLQELLLCFHEQFD